MESQKTCRVEPSRNKLTVKLGTPSATTTVQIAANVVNGRSAYFISSRGWWEVEGKELFRILALVLLPFTYETISKRGTALRIGSLLGSPLQPPLKFRFFASFGFSLLAELLLSLPSRRTRSEHSTITLKSIPRRLEDEAIIPQNSIISSTFKLPLSTSSLSSQPNPLARYHSRQPRTRLYK